MADRRDADLGSLLPVLKAAFVLLVGASAALSTVFGDAPLSLVGLAGLSGLAVGVLLVRIAFPSTSSNGRGREDDPFRDG